MNHNSDTPTSAGLEHGLDAVESAIAEVQAADTAPAADRLVGYQTELAGKAAQIDRATSESHLTPPTPTPPPKRPKGRLLIGSFLMGLLLAGLYIVWDGIFRYQAYGIVEANRIPIESAGTGIIRRVYVTEGDHVRAGDLLAVMDNVAVEHELERTREELRLAEAQLDAHVSDLRMDTLKRSVLQKWDIHDNAAELFELTSRLRQHSSEADRLERQLERTLKLYQNDAATDEQLDRIEFSLKGERELIEMLMKAVNELKERQATLPPAESVDLKQMGPALVQIENLQNELQRLVERLRESRITAPVSGTVLQQRCVAGRRVVPDQLLLEIIQEGSTEPVIYISQPETLDLHPGDQIVLHVQPNDEPLMCRIRRIGDEFVHAPPAIERYYGHHEPLLPVTLDFSAKVRLKPGAVVQMPYAL
jgi:multidrug resistance efflux pump